MRDRINKWHRHNASTLSQGVTAGLSMMLGVTTRLLDHALNITAAQYMNAQYEHNPPHILTHNSQPEPTMPSSDSLKSLSESFTQAD